MHKTVFKLPRLGGNESEARILAWKKAPGEAFAADETLLDVETDKAVVEVPAPAAGVMGRPLKAVDEMADYDEALAEIELEGEPAPGAAAPAGAAAGTDTGVAAAPPRASAPQPGSPRPARAGARVPASPAARHAAREAGVDLAALSGSGPGGRVVLRDLPAPAAGGGATAVEATFNGARGDLHLRRWHAAAAATRPTVVLIHGLYGDADTWAVAAKGLADAGQPVLALDLPLHGRSTADAAGLDDLVAAVQGLLDARVPGPRLLVGHSLGGAVALKLAQASGARGLAGLALIAPAGLGTEIDTGFVDGMLHAREPALLRRELDKLTTRPQPFGDSWLADLHGRLRGRADALERLVGSFAVRGAQQIDLRAALAVLAAQGLPIAVLWGRRDRVLPWQHALDLPPQVALHLFAEAGHLPQAEQPAAVVQLLLRMLR
ncbi:alpha/beta fold hydrolase [Pseudorhodoferax sp.]|uniref:alpha/beta fold hydrolase n=1 Tax=Pseudorhodoferax sp. TaxID=1993553 RepID=UPI002DD63AEA|nr:alpha/beta fold hydrolase [Pseudorhodoferax sp.]